MVFPKFALGLRKKFEEYLRIPRIFFRRDNHILEKLAKMDIQQQSLIAIECL